MKGDRKHTSIEEIRRYRANEMTPAERNAFERELQKDPFLAEASEGLEQLSPEKISQHLQELSTQISRPKESRKIRYFAAAASILILLSIGIIWVQIGKQDPIPGLTQAQKTEIPAKVQEEENVPPPTETGTQLPISKTETTIHKNKQETQKATTGLKPEKTAPAIPPAEKHLPVVIAEAYEKEEIQPVEILTSKAQGSDNEIQDIPQIKNVAVHVIPKDKIMIRGSSTAKPEQIPANAKVLRGKVFSAADKMPLPGVTIIENGTSNGTVTDDDGNFVLPLKDSTSTVTANFIGMVQKVISPADSLNAIIELEPGQLALDEVVVVGYGVQKKQTVTGSVSSVSTGVQIENQAAAPVPGYKAYHDYINSEAILPPDYPKDKVVVRLLLKLNRYGKIKSVEKLNQSDETLFLKAQQIVLQGPAWNPEISDHKKVGSSVKLRIVFRKKN